MRYVVVLACGLSERGQNGSGNNFRFNNPFDAVSFNGNRANKGVTRFLLKVVALISSDHNKNSWRKNGFKNRMNPTPL